MAVYDIFLSFRGRDIRKSLTEMFHAFINDEERSEAAIVAEDFISFQLQDFECINNVVLWETSSPPVLYLDEIADIHSCKKKWSNIRDFDEEKLMVPDKYGSVYKREHRMGMVQSWTNVLVDAMVMADIMVELRNLVVKKVNEIPRSVFCCYPFLFLNLQKKKGISWKVAATDAASATRNIWVCDEFTSFIGVWDYHGDLDLHLASSTRQPQPCSKMSSNASKQSFSSNQRASKLRILVGCMETTYKPSHVLRTKNIDRGPPPPENDIFFTTYHTRSRTSCNGLLATICVLATFIAALGFSSSTFKEAYSTSKDLITSRLLIAMNTLVFVVSLVMDMFLVQKYTYKWELQIALFSLFGAYLCLMKVMIPQATVPLLLLSVPFLFFAAA